MRFSQRQKQALTWWCPGSPYEKRDAVICDGAVRSGKTACLSLSFLLWSFAQFEGKSFAMCGKTISSLRRNLVSPLLTMAEEYGFVCREVVSRNLMEVELEGRRNSFYLFGGKDEGSGALIQGMTLAGVLFDEVALMPRSFVEQALARCSVEGSKFWFSCNPSHPGHWFYREWIAGADGDGKNALYLHFTMEDNPGLSAAVRERYEALYTGVFRERYVLGRWSAVHGAVYPMFSAERHVVEKVPECNRFLISCDYGTRNPASFGLWGRGRDGIWYRVREFYFDSKERGRMMTDEEYADALEKLAGDSAIEAVIVDPSAASFLQCLRKRGRFRVLPAVNKVREGIRLVASALSGNELRFHKSCRDAIREFGLYRWGQQEGGSDNPVKEDDHAMDDIRYFVAYLAGEDAGTGFWAGSIARKGRNGK